MIQRHRSSAVPLAWLYGALIVYASLYPFAGWRVPGVGPLDFLILHTRGWTWFDLISNLLGYLPLGFLLFVALLRSGLPAAKAAGIAFALGTVLSFALEVLQNYLPLRASSIVDLMLNALGTGLGVGLGALLHARGGVERWQMLRDRWFVGRSAGGLALLLLWPIGLLFPTAVPFGLGQVLGRVQPALAAMLQGTPAEAWTAGWADAAARAQFRPAACVRLDHGAGGAGDAGRPGGGGAAEPGAAARRRRLRPDHADRARDAGGAGAGRSVFRAEPEGLGAGSLHPLPRRGAVGRLGLAVCGPLLPAGPAGIT